MRSSVFCRQPLSASVLWAYTPRSTSTICPFGLRTIRHLHTLHFIHGWASALLWAIAIMYESCVFVEMLLGRCVRLSWLAPWALFLGICCWDTVICVQFFKTLPSRFPGWLPHCTAPPAAYKDHGFSKSRPILATLFDDSYPSKCEDLSW